MTKQSNYIQHDVLPRDGQDPSPWAMVAKHMFLRVYHIIWFIVYLVCNCGFPTVRETSEWVEAVITRPKNLRHLFLNTEVMSIFPCRTSHSHPTSAMYRTAVNNFMNTLATRAGMEPFNVSKSPTDGGKGTRYFYGAKDLATPYVDDKVGNNDVIIMCDVDYYTDMTKWLSYFRPILMYTFVPTSAAARRKDYAYRLIDDHVEFHVAGGSSYRHKLWNYKGDYVSTVDDSGNLLVFHLEQRNIIGDPDHRYIVLTPLAKIPSPFHWFLPKFEPIRRHSFLQDGTSVLYEPINDTLSLAPNGAWHSVDILGTQYSAIKQRLLNKSAPPVMSDIERLLRASGDENAVTNAPLIFNLMHLNFHKNVVLTNGVVSSFQPLGSLATEDGKPSGKQLTPPLVSEPAVFPTKGVNADEATIKGRITSVANPVVPPRKYKDYANEFTNCIVKRAGTGSPLSVDEVRKLQPNPQQKARFNKVEATLTTTPQNDLKAFIKSEAYGNVTDPRNITTMSPELTVMLSGFTYAFKQDCLKNQKWYGPGKTPTQTLKALAALSDLSDEWLTVDYSRLDGTVSEFLQRSVVMATYLKWVAEEHKAELKHELEAIFIKSGRTANGVKFNPGYGTRSGSPITTDGNTMICAYVVYCCFRELGYKPKEAFDSIGLVYGDDGAFPALPGLKEKLEIVSKQLGLKIKLDVSKVGEPLPYLGRFFVDPKTCKDSFQDPIRTISKLHLTANKTVTPEQALANKAHGYLATDSKTPIIGTWAAKVIELTGRKTKGLLREEAFKLSNAWPQANKSLITEAMAKVLDLQLSELIALDQKINQVTALDQLPVLLETVRETKIPAVLGDEVVEPGLHVKSIESKQVKDTKPKDVDAPTTGAADSVPSLDKDSKCSCQTSSITTAGKASNVRGNVRQNGDGAGRGGRGHGPSARFRSRRGNQHSAKPDLRSGNSNGSPLKSDLNTREKTAERV
ncbi:RNA-dependent RNA polymerase [Hubei orthoptera virus 4]|uniref:RNA-dependent RNA polymerase n=1 Tax=Hubei orthoptera virus 4 TaxID=1923012 RepID=UPI00090A1608|nr:RNA-dependent RNA polymerase [Hubei orthoptera virus 4]APG76654.1 RNA-dependent RNA polymerase [Hubei orthoptera virus 4]